MERSWEVSVDVAAPPERAWTLVGDPLSVPLWYPQYVRCELDGDVRRAWNVDGAELVERLFDRDEGRRFFSYEIVSGLPLRSYVASFEVVPEGSGSRIVWRVTGEHQDPAVDLQQRLTGRQTEALGRMKALIEGGDAS
jgi:mxaD protein